MSEWNRETAFTIRRVFNAQMPFAGLVEGAVDNSAWSPSRRVAPDGAPQWAMNSLRELAEGLEPR